MSNPIGGPGGPPAPPPAASAGSVGPAKASTESSPAPEPSLGDVFEKVKEGISEFMTQIGLPSPASPGLAEHEEGHARMPDMSAEKPPSLPREDFAEFYKRFKEVQGTPQEAEFRKQHPEQCQLMDALQAGKTAS